MSCIFIHNYSCTTILQQQNLTLTNTTIPAEDNSDTMMNDLGPVCKRIDPNATRQGESAAEQYWERFVLGIHKSKLGEMTVTFDNDRYV